MDNAIVGIKKKCHVFLTWHFLPSLLEKIVEGLLLKRQTSILENGLIWLGAAISIAEIQAGTYLAPLGLLKGSLAIILGHLIGCSLLFLAGVIGGQTRLDSMATAQISFGKRGALVFAVLNICQLIGWTGIMIYDGGLAAEYLWHLGQYVWCLVIGGLIVGWLILGIARLKRVNLIVMTTLLLLTVALSWRIFSHPGNPEDTLSSLSFGAAIELAVAMPLSWLPLISDYTSKAKQVAPTTLVSVLAYGIVSCWMALIGLGASLFTGQLNIAKVIYKSGLGVGGLIIVILSTVTTTFMDAYSAGASAHLLWPKITKTNLAIITTLIGTLGAMWLPLANISSFLYLIGSVFAPMIAILITDYYCLHQTVIADQVNKSNLLLWLVGFILYRWLMRVNSPLGSTLPDIAVVVILCLCSHWITGKLFYSK